MRGLIIASDLHISDYIWRSLPGVQGDSYWGLTQVVDLAIEYKSDVLLAGDVLEMLQPDTPTSKTVGVVAAQLQRLQDADLRVGYIAGQHDITTPSWLNSINPWAMDMHFKVAEFGGLKWFGINNQRPEEFQDSLNHIPDDVDALLLHQRWKEFDGGSNFDAELAHVAANLPELKFIVSGDLHKQMTLRFGQTVCISPGATHKRTIAEPESHSVVYMDGKGGLFSLPLKSRPVVNITPQTVEGWSKLKPRLQQACKGASESSFASGMPASLCRPLVIVEDRGGVGAVEDARQFLANDAVVLTRRPKVSTDVVEVASLFDARESGFDAKAGSVNTVIDRVIREQYGANQFLCDALSKLYAGTDITDIRTDYLRSLAGGSTQSDRAGELLPAQDVSEGVVERDHSDSRSDGQREDQSTGSDPRFPF